MAQALVFESRSKTTVALGDLHNPRIHHLAAWYLDGDAFSQRITISFA
jgi:hypothetical protein